MTQLNKDISQDAYNEFLSDVATAVQQKWGARLSVGANKNRKIRFPLCQ